MFKKFLMAMSFLTVIPIELVPKCKVSHQQPLSEAVPAFPLVGAFLGLCLVTLAIFFQPLCPPWAFSSLMVFLLAILSGGLHLDGLADTADGFFSSRPKDQILKIMHDSRIGAMGVIALFFGLWLKICFLAETSPDNIFPALFITPLLSRTGLLWSMNQQKCLQETGIGSAFWHKSSFLSTGWLMTVLFISVCLAGATGILACAMVWLFLIIFGKYCDKKIGGGTGDTLGASLEISEIICLFTFCCYS